MSKNIDAEKSAIAAKAVEGQPRTNGGRFDVKPVPAANVPTSAQTPQQKAREKVKEDPSYQERIQSLELKYRQALEWGIPDFLGESYDPGPAVAPRQELGLMLAFPDLMEPLDKIASLEVADLEKLLSLSKGLTTKSRVHGAQYKSAVEKVRELCNGDYSLIDDLYHLVGDKIRSGKREIVAKSNKYEDDEMELMVIDSILYYGVTATLVKNGLTQEEYDTLIWPVKKVIPTW